MKCKTRNLLKKSPLFFTSVKVSVIKAVNHSYNHDNRNNLRPRHDYLIRYAYFVKYYLERFTSISDPEKWTTNVVQRKNRWNVISNNTWHCFVNDVTKHVFLNGEGLQKLILGIYTRGSGWGEGGECTNVSCQLKFRPLVSCQLNFRLFVSCS